MTELAAYGGLFLSAFLAASIFPAQSEVVFTAMLLDGDYGLTAMIVSASIGNTLGSVVNWALGRGVRSFQSKRWFPVKEKALSRATGWYHRYGRWSLLLSWAPFVGDPLTLAAGVLKEPWWSFVLIVALAKTGRYIALAAIVLHWV